MESVPKTECTLHRKNINDKVKNNAAHAKRVEGESSEIEIRLLERIIELERRWNWIIGLLVLNLGGIVTILLRGTI